MTALLRLIFSHFRGRKDMDFFWQESRNMHNQKKADIAAGFLPKLILQRREICVSRTKLLFSYSLKPFQHTKHDGHGDEANQGEDRPCHPLMREGVQHLDTKEDQ